MRILTLTLLVLVAVVAFSLPTSRPLSQLAPVASCATCDYLNADAACTAQRLDRFYSCVLVSGPSITTEDCSRDSMKYYYGCMKAWGCGVAPTSSPGDS